MTRKEYICYTTDSSRIRGKTERVIFPRNSEEVENLIKTIHTDIIPRGAGTGLVGGCVPNNSVVVDMSKMDKVLNFNPKKGIVYAQAGVTLKELNQKLNSVGFEFPIDVGNRGISTIGGMIATNASGNRSAKYGKIKEWIDEIEFVNGRGELMKTGKTDLMEVCGMEGITGIILGATLKIIPQIKRTASIFQSEDLEEILSIARRLKLEKEVVMLEFFSKQVSKLFGLPEKYHIIIEFDSDRGKIKGKDYGEVLKFKQDVYFKLYSQEYYSCEDPKFFFDKLGEFIIFLENNKIPFFGFLDEGIIHPFFRDEEIGKKQKVFDFIKKTNARPGKYGIGLNRKEFLDESEKKIIQRVKMRHDPFSKLNNRKVIDIDINRIHRRDTLDLNKDIEDLRKRERKIFIRPSGEERSARNVIEDIIKEEKSPEQELNSFIEEVSEIEKFENQRKEVEKEQINKKTDIKLDKEKEQINQRIKDYEFTYDSELDEEKRKKVEELARAVQRRVVRRPEKSTKDYSQIHKIMTNQVGPRKSEPVKEAFQETEVLEKWRLDALKNQKTKEPITRPEKRVSDEEKDIINKIMLNKFGLRSNKKQESEEDKDNGERKLNRI